MLQSIIDQPGVIDQPARLGAATQLPDEVPQAVTWLCPAANMGATHRHLASQTQACTPRRPENTHSTCSNPKSSRSALSNSCMGRAGND